jgi:D-tyrosyl-tRNA(Tyr) deacylase
MRVLIQRVSEASVSVEEKIVGQISRGFLLLLGVAEDDSESDLEYLLKKVPALRVFPDKEGRMNLSIEEVQGEILVVSQFTLIADTAKGNRPSFFRAAKPLKANSFYENFVEKIKNTGLRIQTGVFGAEMKVSLVNDGPVTILLDSKEI